MTIKRNNVRDALLAMIALLLAANLFLGGQRGPAVLQPVAPLPAGVVTSSPNMGVYATTNQDGNVLYIWEYQGGDYKVRAYLVK